MSAPSPRAATLMVAAAAASWGCWGLFLRPSGLPAAASSVVILVVQGLVLLPVALRSRPPRPWDRESVALLGANALLDAVNVITFFAAIGLTTIGVAVLTHYLAPVLVALAAPWAERQRVPGAIVAAAAALLGLALVLEPWRGGGDGRALGAVLGAASAFAYAGNVLVVNRLARRIGAAATISYHSLLSAVLLLPFAALSARDGWSPGGTALLAVGACLLGGLAAWLFVRGLAVIGSTRAAVLTYLEPLVAVALGVVVFGETLGAWAFAGAALVLASGAWTTLSRSRARATGAPAA